MAPPTLARSTDTYRASVSFDSTTKPNDSAGTKSLVDFAFQTAQANERVVGAPRFRFKTNTIEDSSHLHYRVIWPEKAPKVEGKAGAACVPRIDDTEALLRHYLCLKVDLEALYTKWSLIDPNFRKHAPKFAGVRILSQDAWETLICFICSSNNNISRISQMVHKLCFTYGPLIGHIGDEAFHDFPGPEALIGDDVEAELRRLGFGYRAKYIAATAKIIAGKPKDWLDSLRNPEEPRFPPLSTPASTDTPITYKQAHKELLQLSGVGPKVADCVCLMGLAWAEAVPVDTHVWQIAQRDYKFGKAKGKTFTMSMYDPVGDFFRDLWGKEAGWAHSVLFTADLKAFSDRVAKKEATTEVKEEEGAATTAKNGGSGQGTGAPRKRQRAPSVKVEEPEPGLELPAVKLLRGTSDEIRRRSPRIRTKG
ncbi:related to N-glycosylase/DNA lyase [Cephalotrichum gorgonifer]|uniref:DNA-(apurinic or apyrimidinic site) lyase n=1 Tax=Cephalotrichum gorgonifer TaxID=2041049 RepID=A0AAE8MP16_9PEZI|nr:related to N-glycosylase/DNA lyase [Cephalotrichum gorgonifer]